MNEYLEEGDASVGLSPTEAPSETYMLGGRISITPFTY